MDGFLCCLPIQSLLMEALIFNLQVRVWNASTGSCLAVAGGHMAAVGAVAFSKKKKNFIVSGSRCGISITLYEIEFFFPSSSSV